MKWRDTLLIAGALVVWALVWIPWGSLLKLIREETDPKASERNVV